MDPALIALLGTVFGGFGLKIIEHVLGRGTKKQDLATVLRAELRQDIASLRAELKEAEKKADEWQSKYYELRTSNLNNP